MEDTATAILASTTVAMALLAGFSWHQTIQLAAATKQLAEKTTAMAQASLQMVEETRIDRRLAQRPGLVCHGPGMSAGLSVVRDNTGPGTAYLAVAASAPRLDSLYTSKGLATLAPDGARKTFDLYHSGSAADSGFDTSVEHCLLCEDESGTRYCFCSDGRPPLAWLRGADAPSWSPLWQTVYAERSAPS